MTTAIQRTRPGISSSCGKQALGRAISTWLALLVLAAFIAGPAKADVQYLYDEVGRLVEVIDEAGNSAQYQYDPAGNISGIRRVVAGELSIAEFTPDAGPIGSEVTIHGVGFGTSPASNSVSFSGVSATVSSASATKLVVTVPGGAATGPISVAVGTHTATSASSYQVTSDPQGLPPTVSGFVPSIGAAGTSVTITGANFDPDAADNLVRFNGSVAETVASSPTEIQTKVPRSSTSGPISVRTAAGMGTSTADFIVTPPGFTAAQVATTGRIAIDGPSQAFSIASANKIGMVLFTGGIGQRVSLLMSSVSITSVAVSVLAPDGTSIGSATVGTSGGVIDLPALPRSGSYTVLLNPGTYTGSITLTLKSEAQGVLAVDAAPVAASLSAGQNGRYTFSGVAGQGVGLALTGLATTPTGGQVSLVIYKPDGAKLRSCSSFSAPGNSCDLGRLPASGTYSVTVDPNGTYGASFSMLLSSEATGTLTVNGPALTFRETLNKVSTREGVRALS